MKTAYQEYLRKVSAFIPQERIYTDELRRLAWGTDAGCYHMVPQVVIRSDNEHEVSLLLQYAHELSLPVTFRAAGTALSGQSLSDSILIVAGKHWENYSVSPDALSITLQPGIIGSRVNDILRPYHRYFGPDPASINSCMVGGIVANNASGMSCGTHANSDKELISARIVLADGTILDTQDPQSRKDFLAGHKDIIDALLQLQKEVKENPHMKERIVRKYSIKNVTGLNLLPLIEQNDPFDLIAHLMVGSEGTLGFISEVKMKTRPLSPFKASAMIYFDSMEMATKAVVALKSLSVSAAELLDKRSLDAVHDSNGNTALLVETQATDQETLQQNICHIEKCLQEYPTVAPVHFTSNPQEYAKFWNIRSGIFPAVGGMREEGTTCIIEDVAFPIELLPQATADISEMLDRHGYKDSCIYGHALEGNFHFIINQSFETAEGLEQYRKMIDDVVHLVVDKYDGSLKAEHGTGRNMAPFVAYEWGEECFEAMKRIKHIMDPKNILNPGVIFNDDPYCHMKDFKHLPTLKAGKDAPCEAHEAFTRLNKCIECGFCEVHCLSCGFSLSSRMRIVIAREMERRRQNGLNVSSLEKSFRYLGEDTCAGDGLCSTSCPMGINVGDLTHELRRQHLSQAERKAWKWAGEHFPTIKQSVRTVLRMAEIGRNLLGDKTMSQLCIQLHDKAGIPLWTPAIPAPYKYKGVCLQKDSEETTVVYIPSCINQMMGAARSVPTHRPLVEETLSLLKKAGYKVIIPQNRESLCCGTIWESKGMPEEAARKTKEMEDALMEASQGGILPVLCDQSPCLHRMCKYIKGIHLYEPAEFIWTFLRDRLVWHQQDISIVIHPTCSMRLMKLDHILYDVASLCATKVTIPQGVECCGFAGDRGMTHPELNKWATRKLKQVVISTGAIAGYSNSRTCEIGLQTNSGIPYMSIVYLVNQCTEAIPVDC